MKKDKLKKWEKEIESKSMKGSINYRQLESGKYIAINTNDRKAMLNEFDYTFESGTIDPKHIYNSVEEIKESFGDEYEYKDVTKLHTVALEELNSHFVN